MTSTCWSLAHDRANDSWHDGDGEERYEVEEILGKRQFGRGKTRRTQYLVVWVGYPRVDATWEDEKDIDQAREALDDYERRQSQ